MTEYRTRNRILQLTFGPMAHVALPLDVHTSFLIVIHQIFYIVCNL